MTRRHGNTDLDIRDEILHAVDHLSDGQILQYVLTHTDDLPNLRLIKRQQKGGRSLQDSCNTVVPKLYSSSLLLGCVINAWSYENILT